ncbi:MAG: bifunctional diaminohydroxyphosphoribosylaminopyrimidine deaminase/5-amino-6-(5-phosphoribosylamino)uracil reductase RibD [Lachnospiraceae bacterium]|nr:bifunctional diaminohydroxyphosphoribosylaminopyrimidine deaminase/5-amino-6-(5-phosphoribosylamino)uracil reductase RibD [Lachnospiraceae bacterium]
MTKEHFMRRAIELAKRGEGKVNPNPLVGAVIVKEGEIIAEGWHRCYGGLHAEREAIANLPDADILKGATMYVTLEPCCHFGKQPPCCDAVIEAGIKKVYVGSKDPNPLVSGKGIRRMRDAGVEVVEGFLEEECDSLNDVFFHYITTKRPYFFMKYAMTADGKIATVTGDSKWISGEQSRRQVHKLRNKYMGIMVGIGTVLKDDPRLDCRLPMEARNPIPIICDSKLQIPLSSTVVENTVKRRNNDKGELLTIVATLQKNLTDAGKKEKLLQLKEKGITVVGLQEKNGHIDLSQLAEKLGEMGIDSVLLEGGGTLNDSALKAGIVNEVRVYVAPKIFGGSAGFTPVSGEGVMKVADAAKLTLVDVQRVEQDVVLSYKVNAAKDGETA